METALFSPAALFRGADTDTDTDTDTDSDLSLSLSGSEQQQQQQQQQKEKDDSFVERTHSFPHLVLSSSYFLLLPLSHYVCDMSFFSISNLHPYMQQLKIREFSFHHLNANLLWPGTFAFAQWLLDHQSFLHARRILELGRPVSSPLLSTLLVASFFICLPFFLCSGTGALAIFLTISLQLDITTSDYDDQQIEQNIAYNCASNAIPPLPHIRHTWGEPFPTSKPDWDLIIASDILLYVKQYPNLIKTLCFLLKAYQPQDQKAGIPKRSITVSGEEIELEPPVFVMSWRRRIGKEDEQLFFGGCEKAGLTVRHVGSRVYCITVGC